MQTDILTDLGLAPEDTFGLDSRTRSRLLSFLLRWRHLHALHACLNLHLAAQPDLVSLIDLRVRAMVIEERYEEAIVLMQQRLEMNPALSAQALMTRVYLAAGNSAAADRIAVQLRTDAPGRAIVWYVTAEAALARGDVAQALAAYQRVREMGSVGRGYLLGMLKTYQAQQDWVTASGYAVRLLESTEDPVDLSVEYLRTLREYFAASAEETHVAEMDEALERRLEKELLALRVALGLEDEDRTADQAIPRGVPQTPRADAADALPEGPKIKATETEREIITQAVRDTFGFTSLLPGQLETMACVLRNSNALTILPTGGGKSLCYQVPAFLADQGLTLVISPLIALMKDQVDSLPELLRQQTTTINSSLDGDILRQRLDRAAKGEYRLLYAAPERLRQPTFLHALRRAGVNRLVVDEAHCVSVWGHDFRPDYLKIKAAWEALESPPILALTATAPPRVRLDIVRHLSPDTPMAIITGDLTRPNLQLEVFHAANKDEKLRRLIAFCQSTSGSGIVYADTRARCEQLAALLTQHEVNAAHYHAGIGNRDQVQEDFMTGRTRVIVATIAFGMGIDKPDIRFVTHFTPPRSLESYYQEAGRAGRDGLPARCLLMFSSADKGTLTQRMHRSLPKVDFLRRVYAVVLRHLNGTEAAGVASGDLERELHVDSTQLRVALSILEENGLLQRGPDIPRATLVRRSNQSRQDSQEDDRLAAFYTAGRLRPGEWVQVNLIAVAEQIGLPPAEMENQLLRWAGDRALDYRLSGRNMLLQLTPPPDDVAQRISQWLERFETIQVQRIAEITGYARTRRCRHGHLNAYLGGRHIDRCEACDNCIAVAPDAEADIPEEHEQMAAILECVAKAPWSWGRRSLVRILKGNSNAPTKAQAYAGYGTLSYRSEGAIEDLISRLEHAGFLKPRSLDRGGIVLDLTASGRAILKTPVKLQRIAPPKRSTATAQVALIATPSTPLDTALYDELRAWRQEKAQQKKILPYTILHNADLKRIATQKPRTPEDLLSIKGIGPKRFDSYGEEILGIIETYLAQQD